MARFTQSELQTLMAIPGPCVSIYLPAHSAGPEIRQDPIRFKNLLKAAEESLLAQGVRRSRVLGLLAPLHELDNDEFWRHQDRGLAAFAAPDFVRHYRLPLEFEALALVAEHFHLTPLLPLLTGDGRFYILALNQSHLRLLEASRDRVRELDLSNLEDVPESLVEAVYQYESTAKQSQFETTAAAAPGDWPGSCAGNAARTGR
ncbi:MAG: hypothetical protein HC890_05200 [Chloroflexaceae bacterium]|nr:hypothetical protein [Chloroflexaceae bacterium]